MKVQQSEVRPAILLFAENDEEIALLTSLTSAINSGSAGACARPFDNLEGGPEQRIINGVLEITTEATQ